MTSILSQLDEFIASTSTNAWVGNSECLMVYVRKSKRYIDHQLVNTIDVANISTIHPDFKGKGYFKSVMLHVESYGLPVYVECIHNPLLVTMLSKHGYQLIPNSYDIHMIKYPVEK